MNDFDKEMSQPSLPDKLTRAVLSELGTNMDFNIIKRKWPEAERITHGLALYLTDFIPDLDDKSSSLLHKCLSKGIKMWDAEGQSFHAYMRGISFYLPEVLEWCVYTEIRRGNDTWDPLSEGLGAWWGRQRSQPRIKKRERPWDPSGQDMSPDSYRLIALVKFVNDQDFSILRRDIDYIVGRQRQAKPI